jgi:hypothetical protein
MYIRVMPPMFRIPRAVWMSQSNDCGGRLFGRGRVFSFPPEFRASLLRL